MAPRRPDTMSYIDTDTLEVRIHTRHVADRII